MSNKLHWYCLTFSSGGSTGSAYKGVEKKELTIEDINIAKKTADMSEQSVLTNSLYMGYMTKEKLTGVE